MSPLSPGRRRRLLLDLPPNLLIAGVHRHRAQTLPQHRGELRRRVADAMGDTPQQPTEVAPRQIANAVGHVVEEADGITEEVHRPQNLRRLRAELRAVVLLDRVGQKATRHQRVDAVIGAQLNERVLEANQLDARLLLQLREEGAHAVGATGENGQLHRGELHQEVGKVVLGGAGQRAGDVAAVGVVEGVGAR